LATSNIGRDGTVVTVQGFDPARPSHVSYVRSLILGRFLFKSGSDLKRLPPVTVCVEARDSDEDRSTLLLGDLVPLQLRKAFDDDATIISSALAVFAKDFSEEIQREGPELKSLMVGFHKFMAAKFPDFVDDHLLYRIVSGVFLARPEVISTLRDISRLLLSEMETEYAGCLGEENSIGNLLEEFSPYLKAKFFKDLEPLVPFFHKPSSGGILVDLRLRKAVEESFEVECAQATVSTAAGAGKLSLTEQAIDNVLGMLRSYHRFDGTILVWK